MEVCVYYGEALGRYGFGHGHPFGPDRLEAFWQEAGRQGLTAKVRVQAPAMATDAELLAFHTPEYVALVKRLSQRGQGYLDYGDTPAFPGCFAATSYVVGSTLDGLAHVLHGDCRAFIPIGGLHHARADSAAGFCIFNDIGVAVRQLRTHHGVSRIVYVDIDAHHGDGVFYAFEDDPLLFIADIHEDGRYLYPGTGMAAETGKGAAVGTKLNIPLAPGADDTEFKAAWPRVEAFVRAARPEIILLQAGADSIAGDPIAHLRYTPAVHGFVAQRLAQVADEMCAGRLLAMGGGGYDRTNLGQAWSAVVTGLLATAA